MNQLTPPQTSLQQSKSTLTKHTHAGKRKQTPNPEIDPLRVGLLDGAPYTPSTHTDVQATWRKYGWTPPSEAKK